MPLATSSALDPFNVDVSLNSAVQTHAGARCHEAANLLSCYMLCSELHNRAVTQQDADEARSSRELLEKTEVNLRKFLFEVRWPQRRCLLAANSFRDRLSSSDQPRERMPV